MGEVQTSIPDKRTLIPFLSEEDGHGGRETYVAEITAIESGIVIIREDVGFFTGLSAREFHMTGLDLAYVVSELAYISVTPERSFQPGCSLADDW